MAGQTGKRAVPLEHLDGRDRVGPRHVALSADVDRREIGSVGELLDARQRNGGGAGNLIK
jgi:hypothetical protein